ncbi:MAG TPA: secretin N-terminal domain-containing protein [Gemmatimonadaceae bacterium]|nr:secretin N-terminal domain-containing protein [Gemmatimonadaceae bacterium]
MTRRLLVSSVIALVIGASAAGAQTPPPAAGTALNFVDTRLSDIIRTLALSLGLNVVLTDVPDKRVTFTTAAPVERRAVGEILESILESNGLVMIQKGSVAQVMPLERAPAQALHTYVIPLKYAAAEDLAAALGKVYGSAVSGGMSQSLDDRSLSRNLDAFRQREATAFQMRRDTPITAPPVSTPAISNLSADPSAGNGANTGNLIGQTTVVANAATNSLIIRTVPPNYSLLRETVEALDTRPPQVLFEVLVAEISLGKSQQFGVDWSALNGTTSAQFGSPLAPDTSAIDDFVLRAVSVDRFKVRAVLRALAATSNVRVLSTPEILASNNREAHILVGSKVPFVVSTRLGNDIAIDRTVQFQDVGTNLTIIPTINSDDYVSVQILQEVSTLTSQTIASALNAPVISTREASTRATIKNGQTVVIGGLIGTTEENTDSGVPFLKDIPIIGNLFKRQGRTRNRTELAIFVTPYIIRNDETADQVRERVRSRLEKQSPGIFNDSLPKVIPPPGPAR